jgi:hypothetical protein
MLAGDNADHAQNAFGGDGDSDADESGDENDFTVYECPGLASTGEMQVDNPLFMVKQQAGQPAGSAPAASAEVPKLPPPPSSGGSFRKH